MEAARQLSAFPLGQLDAEKKKVVKKAFDEYEKVLLFTAERPETQLSLAMFYVNLKMPEKADKAYVEAMRLQPQFVPAYINYSNFLVQQGENKKAFEILQKGLDNVPNIAIFHHALGLLYVRNKETEKAIPELKKSVELDKDNPLFSYVYAVSIGEENPKEAIKVLEESYAKHTGDMQIVSGLVYYTKKICDTAKSAMYEEKLKALQNFSVR
ncbi:tetratricopeptide repeat protein [Sulfurovum sp.]|uniref:tetratricopeptide repeat protein n=1 Tax=Sulfurovum sp. TaxID=1969726 RepID=UPI0035629285